MAKFTGKRKHQRTLFTTTVEYVLLTKNGNTFPHNPKKGITLNISKAGICLLTFMPVETGQKLKILRGIFPDENKTAEVRWVKKVSNEIHKSGLMFL